MPEAAGDAKHRRAAVVALDVELERLDLGVVVALPRGAADVARRLVNRLRLAPVDTLEDGELDVGAVRDCKRGSKGWGERHV